MFIKRLLSFFSIVFLITIFSPTFAYVVPNNPFSLSKTEQGLVLKINSKSPINKYKYKIESKGSAPYTSIERSFSLNSTENKYLIHNRFVGDYSIEVGFGYINGLTNQLEWAWSPKHTFFSKDITKMETKHTSVSNGMGDTWWYLGGAAAVGGVIGLTGGGGGGSSSSASSVSTASNTISVDETTDTVNFTAQIGSTVTITTSLLADDVIISSSQESLNVTSATPQQKQYAIDVSSITSYPQKLEFRTVVEEQLSGATISSVLLDTKNVLSLSEETFDTNRPMFQTSSSLSYFDIVGSVSIPNGENISQIGIYYGYSTTVNGTYTYQDYNISVSGTGVKNITLSGLASGYYKIKVYYIFTNTNVKRIDSTETSFTIDKVPSVAERNKIVNTMSIGLITPWEQGYTGQGVKVGVLDSGFNLFHDDLKNRINVSESFDFTHNKTLQAVIDGGVVEMNLFNGNHGTHVAGIIGAESNGMDIVGVAYNSTLNVYKIASADYSGDASTTNIINGINLAVSQNVKVLNLSYGGYSTNQSTFDYFGNIFNSMTGSDTSIIVAAGNEGKFCDSIGTCNFLAGGLLSSSSASITSNAGTIVVVGAYDNGTGDIASFSNRAGLYKDSYIMAPGVAINSLIGADSVSSVTSGTVYKSGTSMATPIVTGSFALMAEKYPNLTGTEIAQIFFDTATDLGVPGVDDVYGHGLINLTNAFTPIGSVSLANSNTVSTNTIINTDYNTLTPVVANSLKTKGIKTAFTDKYNRLFVQNTTASISKLNAVTVFDTLRVTEIQKDSPLLVVLDEGKQSVGIGVKFKNKLKLITSHENGLFGSEGNDLLGFGGQTNYITLVKDVGNIVYNLSYGLSNISGIGSVSGSTMASGLSGSIRYKFTDNFSVETKIPLFIVSGKLNNIYSSSMDSLETMTVKNQTINLKTENIEKRFNLNYNQPIFRDLSLSFDGGYIQNVMSTNKNEFNTNLGFGFVF